MAIKLPKSYPGTVSIRLIEEANSLHLIWHSFHDSPTVRQSILDGVEYCKEHGVTGWIADTQHCSSAMSTGDQEWIRTTSVPAALKAGVKFVLTVLPEQLAVRIANEPWEQQVAKAGFIQQNFASLADTVAFIKKTNESAQPKK